MAMNVGGCAWAGTQVCPWTSTVRRRHRRCSVNDDPPQDSDMQVLQRCMENKKVSFQWHCSEWLPTTPWDISERKYLFKADKQNPLLL